MMKISLRTFLNIAIMVSATLLSATLLKGGDSMKLSSTAFTHEDKIPVKYTAQGEEVSPPLAWEDVPQGTQSLALICDDPDAPGRTYDHWVLYDIPPSLKGLPEGFKASSSDIKAGENSSGTLEYVGPNPPSGTHRYFFKLYALDTTLNFPKNPTKGDLLKAMEGHVLAEATLMGRYQRH
jgi:Raf kinase inhibitor-like YbhB/YbcL family protein